MNGRTGLRTVLITLALLILPIVVFPAKLGTQLAGVSWLTILGELLFFTIAAVLLLRKRTWFIVGQMCLMSFAYRLCVGAIFGLMIAAFYGLNFGVSLRLGMFSYLPAVLLHIVVTPFVIRGLLVPSPERETTHRPAPRPVQWKEPVSGATSIAISREKGVVSHSSMPTVPADSPMNRSGSFRADGTGPSAPVEQNGFDKAVRYIGEYGSVYMAAVVDNEGLTLGHFCRGSVNAEDWAPLALVLMEINRAVTDRNHMGSPDKLDLLLSEHRVVVSRDKAFALMVVSERQADETLNIRINQGMEMIRKYAAERYGHKLETNAERIHVSSTQ
ncbi:MAG TPA: hypothetical protein VMS71_05380 [Candidatus Acidoferrum sp.]|nr:hypothetical protein [Candidatus Acidoferrum sp.]